MLTFIAFILTIIGCINWLLIGLLQYDFIAGLFGYQASIFSRLCYIIIGVGCLYLIIRIIINKGSLKVYEKRKKKASKNEMATASVEAGKEQDFDKFENEKSENNENSQKNNDFSSKNTKKSENLDKTDKNNDSNVSNKNTGLFDEHLKM